MISILEAQSRCENGPLMDEEKFNLKFMKYLRTLPKKYGIELKEGEFIPDDETADKVFEAAVDLILNVGLYNIDTNRVLEFTKEEITHTINSRRNMIHLGEGTDTIHIKHRWPEDKEPIVMCSGPAGLPVEEQYYVPLNLSFAKLPNNVGYTPTALLGARGFANKAETPGELMTVLAEAAMNREVARQAGKPKAFILEPMSAVSPYAVFASFNPDGYSEKGSLMPTHVLPDLKINWERIILAAYALERGIQPWSGAGTGLGTNTRNPIEAAISQIAGTLGVMSYNNGHSMWTSTFDRNGLISCRQVLQMTGLVNVAVSRNLKIPIAGSTGSAAGPCTTMALKELAACMIATTVSGAGWIWLVLPGKGVMKNGATGMEGQMCDEVGKAVLGMDRKTANELIGKLLATYEDKLMDPPQGKSFPECYDVVKVEPTEEYKQIYAEAKEEMRQLGVPFVY